MIPSYLKKNIDSLVAAVLGFVVIQGFTSYGGIGISPDSIAYIGAARNIVGGNGFTEFTGSPLVAFPLIYPSFLAILMFVTQTDILAFAPLLNGFLFAVLVFMSGVIMEKFKYKTKLYKRLLLAIIICSPSLIEIYIMLWSETVFILLIILYIFLFQRYFRTHSYKSLIAAAIIAALAFDTRYAGITIVGTGCLLLFFDKNLNWKRKASHIFVFGGVGISLVSVNLIRNVLVGGLATGMRQKGITPFTKNVAYSGNVLSQWFSLYFKEQLYFELLAMAVMILFVTFFIRNFRHWKAFYSFENIAVSFFIVYVLFIIISSTFSRYETINNRLLAPVFIPLIWISTCQIPKWRAQLPHRQLKWIFFAFSLGFAVLLIGSYIAVNRESLTVSNNKGIRGYGQKTWTQSKLIAYLQKHNELFDKDSTIYSNHNQAVYLHTGHVVTVVPERAYKEDVDCFKKEGIILLLWFDFDKNPDLLNLDEIKHCKKMKCVKSFPDGSIYLLTNK